MCNPTLCRSAYHARAESENDEETPKLETPPSYESSVRNGEGAAVKQQVTSGRSAQVTPEEDDDFEEVEDQFPRREPRSESASSKRAKRMTRSSRGQRAGLDL